MPIFPGIFIAGPPSGLADKPFDQHGYEEAVSVVLHDCCRSWLNTELPVYWCNLAPLMKTELRILLADDDHDDLTLFESLIRREAPDAAVHTVKDGTEVLSYLASCPELYLPTVLVLDYNMPQMTGAQVLDAICKEPKYHGIAKFMLSTASQPEYIDGCKKKGVIEYFVKASNVEGMAMIAREIVSFASKLKI
jgi:CheY-like chemotaxis protein